MINMAEKQRCLNWFSWFFMVLSLLSRVIYMLKWICPFHTIVPKQFRCQSVTLETRMSQVRFLTRMRFSNANLCNLTFSSRFSDDNYGWKIAVFKLILVVFHGFISSLSSHLHAEMDLSISYYCSKTIQMSKRHSRNKNVSGSIPDSDEIFKC